MKLVEGDRVKARWPDDGKYYPGTIIKVFKHADRYRILFDDIDRAVVLSKHVREIITRRPSELRQYREELRLAKFEVAALLKAIAEIGPIREEVGRLQADLDLAQAKTDNLRHELDLLKAPGSTSGALKSVLPNFDDGRKTTGPRAPGHFGSKRG